jgi:flagellar FliL protein
MSAAAPTVVTDAPAPVKKGKKKLVIIAAAALLVLLVVGGGAAFYLKKKAAHDAAAEDGAAATEQHAAKPDLKHPPTFLPLDPFVVNLADKDADRYAQVGITLEVEDAKFAEQMKAFMPAIRNGILMILAHKSSRELLERSGKEQLATEILREASRTMGIAVEEIAPAAEKSADGDKEAADEDDDPKAKPKSKAKAKASKEPAEPNPIRHVHFSNFIIQ